jgi:Family of unknown function (DUF5675)
MIVTLKRLQSSDQGTFGRLTYGLGSCFTTELPWRDNLAQKSCIPTGTYECAIVNSPKFGRVYGVLNVQGRANVLIHPANFGGNSDLGYTTELHGCIAPCGRLGMMRNKVGEMQAAGLISKPSWSSFMSAMNGKPFALEIS